MSDLLHFLALIVASLFNRNKSESTRSKIWFKKQMYLETRNRHKSLKTMLTSFKVTMVNLS